jgi:arylsulfatase A-like enzyme
LYHFGFKKMDKKKASLIGWSILVVIALLILVVFVFWGRITGNVINEEGYGFNQQIDAVCKDCNVILISVDTFRADHLPCYGYERNTAPNICELSENSFQFNDLYSVAHHTLLAHMSMLTSLYPGTHKVINDHSVLSPKIVTLAETFREEGYKTAGLVSGGYLSSEFGYAQGFNSYNDEIGLLNSSLPEAKDFLEKNKNNKFFLFLHTYDLHYSDINESKQVYYCPTNFQTAFLRDPDYFFDGCSRTNKSLCAAKLVEYINRQINNGSLLNNYLYESDIDYFVDTYDGGIAYVDSKIGELILELERLELDNKTIVVITSDHGEEFGEHKHLSHTQLYDEVLHVPLIISIPGFKEGITIDELVSTVDIMPTILELVGIKNKSEIQGISTVDLMFNKNHGALRESVYSFFWRNADVESIRTKDWKFFYQWGAKNSPELYDLEKDPLEKDNLAKKYPKIADNFSEELDRQTEANSIFLSGFTSSENEEENGEISSQLLESLRALGYVN